MHKLRLQLLTLLPKGEQGNNDPDATSAGYSCTRYGLSHMEQQQLDAIVRQVHVEGYYAEYVAAFAADGMTNTETVQAICRWARQIGLKVSFSDAADICVLELG